MDRPLSYALIARMGGEELLGLARIVGLSEAYPERSFDLLVAEPRAEVPRRQRAAWSSKG